MKLAAFLATLVLFAIVALIAVSSYGAGVTSGTVRGYQLGLGANSSSVCARVEVWARANLNNEKARVASKRDTAAYAKLVDASVVATKNYICGTGANPAFSPLPVALGAPTISKAAKASSSNPVLLSGRPSPKPSPSPTSSPTSSPGGKP